MIHLLSLAYILLSLLSTAASQGTAVVEAAFDAANIPAETDIAFDPSLLLEVTYMAANNSVIEISVGENVPLDDTTFPPIYANGPSANSTESDMVIVMLDLDAPSPEAPTLSPYRHFLGGNFRAISSMPDGTSMLANSTQAVTEYLNPMPPAGSGYHRYVWFIYKQSSLFNSQTLVNEDTPRHNFNLSHFASELALGSPLGGMFMRTANTTG